MLGEVLQETNSTIGLATCPPPRTWPALVITYITLFLTNEANGGQMTQIRLTLDGIGATGSDPPSSLAGSYIVTRNDAQPDCLGRGSKSVLLDCRAGTACDPLP